MPTDPSEYERLADRIAEVDYNSPAAGNDKRGIIFGLTRAERESVVDALRFRANAREEVIARAIYEGSKRLAPPHDSKWEQIDSENEWKRSIYNQARAVLAALEGRKS